MDEAAAGLSQSLFEKVPIWSLSDDLLSRIFTYLNPNDRFRLAEVCTRWAGVSRMDWTDVTSLDLSSISKENVGPLIHLCPKLESITAQDCELNVMSITANLRSKLRSFRLYRVSASAGLLTALEAPPRDGLSNEFLLNLRQLTHLEEVVLSELPVARLEGCIHFVWDNLPASLKRLQLNIAAFGLQFGFLQRVERPFGTIDCLILQEEGLLPAHDVLIHKAVVLLRLRQLRELSLDACLSAVIVSRFGSCIVSELSRLEILNIQFSIDANVLSGLVPLLHSHPKLRILIITGAAAAFAGEILIPRRRRCPNDLGSDPLPILHVFIGGQIAQKIRFRPNESLEIHPITLPMPAFLEQPEVAAIFKGSWIAKMIKNSRLWDYDALIAQSVRILNS